MDKLSGPNRILNVLCLEDSIHDAELMREILADAGFEMAMCIVASEKQYVDELREKKSDIILADYNLPGFNAAGALKHAREICPATPFICVSGVIGEETVVELLKNGATDYVSKNRLHRLPITVSRALKESAEKTAHQKAEFEIQVKNEQLEKINAEKDKFFSIIAHDLRSPFNNFLGLTQIMARDLPLLTMDEIQKIAVVMEKSANNLFRLLENLLQWSRMQQGLISVNPEILPVSASVDESIEMILELARNKGIEICKDIPDDVKVFADSNILQLVIRNLVSNAVKFTHKGGHILIEVEELADHSVELSIKDTGIGMNKAMLDKLFRLGEDTSRKGTDGELSTGLGLILCRDCIEKLGGRIWVESEEGTGSTFHVTLVQSGE